MRENENLNTTVLDLNRQHTTLSDELEKAAAQSPCASGVAALDQISDAIATMRNRLHHHEKSINNVRHVFERAKNADLASEVRRAGKKLDCLESLKSAFPDVKSGTFRRLSRR
jgi:hypothetical protein